MESGIFKDLVILFFISTIVLFICRSVKFPQIVGLLFTGIIIGPKGFHLIKSAEDVELLSELGVIMLLFSIGIEFSLKNLMRIKNIIFIGGSIQVFITGITFYLLGKMAGFSIPEAIIGGCLISLSSTAIILKHFQEKGDLDTPHGKTTLGILLFQDIIVIPMMLMVPFLSGIKSEGGTNLAGILIRLAGLVVMFIVLTKWMVPTILYHIARTRSREMLLSAVFVICFGIALITSKIGLSLAFGAFLAGLIISESDYSHEVMNNVLPFRDIFICLFFVSIGMLMDAQVILKYPFLILAVTTAVIIIKILLSGAAVIILKYPLRTAILSGFALAQVGEFSFILSKTAVKYNILSPEYYQIFLAVSILTMVLTPLIIVISSHVSDAANKLPVPGFLSTATNEEKGKTKLENHIIIAGYGPAGQNVARAAEIADIPYIIVEMNPDTVKKQKNKNKNIIFGDITRDAVYHHLGIETAAILAIVISDMEAIEKSIRIARSYNPDIHIIVRTRYISDIDKLMNLGADEVISEEKEISIEVFFRIMKKYLVSEGTIASIMDSMMNDFASKSAGRHINSLNISDLKFNIPGITLDLYLVNENPELCGKQIRETDLRKKKGISILAIKRYNEIIPNPDGDFEIKKDDILLLLGTKENIAILKS